MSARAAFACGFASIAVAACGGVPPVIHTFTAQPQSAAEDQIITLAWSVGGASRCTIAPGVGAVAADRGHVGVAARVEVPRYRLDCRNAAGGSAATVTVVVAPQPPTIVTFLVTPAVIAPGQSAALHWQVRHAAACRLDPGFAAVETDQGARAITPPASVNYTLSCAGAAGVTAADALARVEVIGDWSLSGSATYDRVPSTPHGLDYGHIVRAPIRKARVALVGDLTGDVLAATTLSRDGRFVVAYHGTNLARVQVDAETDDPPIRVQDNTESGALYVLETPPLDLRVTDVAALHAASGWTGSSYGRPRAAAPFAVLDSILRAAEKFAAVRALVFPRLVVNWSSANRPENGDPAAGKISTSQWDGREMNLLGAADVDTDEYDDDVIVHEWGHYFEDAFSRSDNIGGEHRIGDILDPRAAFSEGWGNALSAIVHDPDTVYTDTYDVAQTAASSFDVEDNDAVDPKPGWFSETSVQSIIYDVYDGANEPWDTVALGLGPIYDVMAGAHRMTPALTSIFSLIAGLKAAAPAAAAGLDLLCAHHRIAAVVDPFGTGQTNDGGVAGSLPVFKTLVPGGTLQLEFGNAGAANDLQHNRFATVVGNGGTLTLATAAADDVDVWVYRNGALIASARGPGGNETVTIKSAAGVVYAVDVLNASAATAGKLSATLSLVSP